MLDALRRDRFHPKVRRAEPDRVSGLRRRADRSARCAQREDLAHLAQFKGRADGAAGVAEGGVTPLVPATVGTETQRKNWIPASAGMSGRVALPPLDLLHLVALRAARGDNLDGGALGLADQGPRQRRG